VLSHLPPRDVLHVARTNRDVRHIVLSRTSKGMWKTCLKESGTPEPPEDFSAPRWAALLYDTECNV
ncbi:hypothetical protein DFP72DRAFT_791022, partial [Ephemerocybe angulata]